MKTATKNLMYFAIFFFIGAIVFRYFLSLIVENRLFDLTWILSAIYFVFNFLIGWYFGKRAYESLPLYNIGFRLHFVTYFLFNITALLWFWLGFHSQFESISFIYDIALIWGFFLVVHFIYFMVARKNTIKGLNKEELFE